MRSIYNTKELGGDGEELHRRLARRAYELYERRGRQAGFALQDWLQAEEELNCVTADLAHGHSSLQKQPSEIRVHFRTRLSSDLSVPSPQERAKL